MRLGNRCLGCALLMLAIVTTPLVSAPGCETPADCKGGSEAGEAKAAEKVKRAGGPRGSARHPSGETPVQVTPKAMTTVVVPANLSQPPALYHLAPRDKTQGGPQPAEMPTPKQIKPRSMAIVDSNAVGPGAPPPPTLPTPPLGTSFDSVDFDSNIANAGFVFIPADPSGAVGLDHAISVTNVSVRFQDKTTGATTFEDSLGAFFAALSPLTYTFDPKVIYDQFADRFVIVTLERTDVAAGGASDTSRILVAVSESSDPNGIWYLTSIDASEVFFNSSIPPAGASADHWVDFPGLAIDEEVVYVTGNMFTFGTGVPGGVRLWVIDKELGTGGFYDGGAADVSRFDPYAGCGPGVDCFEITTQPAHVFGTAPTSPTNVGTWLTSYSGISDGLGAGFDEFVQIVRIDDPVGPGVTTFTQEFVNVGDIEDPFAAPLPGADQLGISDTISTNGRRALQAVWRDNDRLYLSATILPDPPAADAGQATAHWFQVETNPLVGLTLEDQGNVGGEDIHASGGVHTFFPAISVNDDDMVAIGFSASSASIYAGSYYATRESADPPGSIGPSITLRAGLAPYLRTFCEGGNRWGDYSGMSIDPVDQCFWVYNQHALATGSPTTAACQPAGNEVGRWGTAFGRFCGPLCGDGTIDPGETCDPPGTPAGGNAGLCRADCTVCGDGTVDPGEDCDDANGADGDGCENDCTVTPPSCGDGQVNAPGETCDPPAQPAGANGNDCRADCTVCGDGVLDAGETCDDGNTDDTDSCHNDCTAPVCGNSSVEFGETCDPPGQPAGVNANDCRPDCTVCGDGALDAGETCDDGNTIDTDACRNDCTAPVCGDDILDSGETCDPPGQPAGANGNDCRGDCTVCGDGAVDAGETCDDGNTVDTDTCRNDCTVPVCGDSILDSGETCDPPGQPAGVNGNDCRGDCTVCGDSAVDAGETCDDGNTVDTDTCRNDCTVPVCGDSILDSGETCDPPGQPAGANGNDCRGDCTVCGDGAVDAGETCDDGNTIDTDSCRNDCTVPVCGDEIVDSGETCDPPGQPAGASGNDCRGDCTVCGDGAVDTGETCDDGNTIDTDTCRNDCTAPVCGDGIVDTGEDCDDGNPVDGDGCESDCTPTPVCGDGELNIAGETCDPPGDPAGANGNDCRADCTVCGDGVVDTGETCDDGNTVDTDTCRNDCTAPVCGDGIVDSGEDCDDGNPVDGDGCENDCTPTPVCGDGALNIAGETCDPPGDPAGANGNDCRVDCTVCGDGVVDAGESCDDGNGIDTDTCRNDCTIPVCGDGILDSGEECDDGNLVNGDGCDDCTTVPGCGDGLINVAGETCDPPGSPAGASSNDCRADCTVCGDGIVDAGEECDDGNSAGTDACRNDCVATPMCGDGQINVAGETCDPPGAPAGASGNDCRVDCTVCGDGVVDAGENCDDGNTSNADGCRNNCNVAVCGDGVLDPGEECDDGNLVNGDGCEADCTAVPGCGDSLLNVAGETCDPPGNPAGVNGNDCRPDCTVCGDGVLDPSEDCDDGNPNNIDGCRNDCVLAECGDGIVDIGETCDPPGQPAGVHGNDCRVDCKVCGDSVVDPGEECDDGNTDNLDGCRNNCFMPRCSDGIIDSGETCDPPGQPAGANGLNCRDNCTVCGDGVVDAGEECDDGNADNLDTCRNDCLAAACGDGVLDAGEDCDDGNAVNGDGCESDCTPTPICGDGLVNAAGETCDPPGQPAGALGNDCRGDCTVCGDGVVDAGEECDDGNADDADTCHNDCTAPICGDGNIDQGESCDPPGEPGGPLANECRTDCTVCGDGIVDAVEECDDGNPLNFDDCRNNCVAAACGDGVVDSGEDCDDGNAVDGDGCESDCTESPVCGDGTVNAPGETCDPPGQPAGAIGLDCREDCTVCGDGVVNAGEECDDGNAENADGCRNDCVLPQCGDGIVDAPDETCDPPGQPAGASGNGCRADCSVCGDGELDAEEDCDDGNTDDLDGCRNNCIAPACGDGVLDLDSEECDDGNLTSEDGCEADCTFTPAGSLTTLVLDRVPGGTDITLRWGPSCVASDTDFGVYEGKFGVLGTHIPQTCTTGGTQTKSFEPVPHSAYYLVVPHNAYAEGSYGTGVDGEERFNSIFACKPRRLGVCL